MAIEVYLVELEGGKMGGDKPKSQAPNFNTSEVNFVGKCQK